jgi:hypothetical protein
MSRFECLPSSHRLSYWIHLNATSPNVCEYEEAVATRPLSHFSLPHQLHEKLKARRSRLLSRHQVTALFREQQGGGFHINNIIKRKAFLAARQKPLIAQWEHIQSVRREKLARDEALLQKKRHKLEMKHEEAKNHRKHILDERRRLHANIVGRAQHAVQIKRKKDVISQEQARQKLETKLMHAAARVQLLKALKKPETSSLSPIDILRKQETAAIRIQRYWRYAHIRPWMEAYRSYEWSEKAWKARSFEETTAFIQDTALLEATKQLLKCLVRMNVNIQRMDLPQNAHRVFLTGWMIVYHEPIVFQTYGPLERDLKLAAQDMIHAWRRYVTHYDMASSLAYRQVQVFLELFQHFLHRFHEWKSTDATRLVENLVIHYKELETIRRIVVEGEATTATHEWNLGIETQQKRILEELEKLNSKQTIQKLVSLSQQPAATTAIHEEKKDYNSKNNNLGSSDETYHSVRAFEQALHDKLMDPETVTIKPLWKNDMKPPLSSKVYWNTIFQKSAHNMEQKDYLDISQKIVSDLKIALSHVVLRGQSRLYESMIEHLDVSLIHHQLVKGVFAIDEWLPPIIAGLKQVCAPMRDTEIAALEKMKYPMDQLQGLFDLLDHMKEDLFLFAFHNSVVTEFTLIQNEKTAFQERLRQTCSPSSIQIIDQMCYWLQKSNNLSDHKPLSYDIIVYEAFLALVTSTEAPTSLPDTLVLDRTFLFKIQNAIQEANVVAVLLMITKSIFPQGYVQESLKKSLVWILKQETTRLADIQATVVDHLKSYITSSNQEDLLRSLIDKSLRKDNVIFTSLLVRIRKALLHFLRYHYWNMDYLSRSGLCPVYLELQAISKRLLHFFRIHFAIYGSFYQHCVEKIFL